MESQEQGFSVMLVGYARISKERSDQTTDLQRDALIKAGVDPRHLFEDHLSGSRDNRPTLKSPLDFLQPGGVILVWKLDRLGRSLSHLLQIVADLEERDVGFRFLTQSNLDTTTVEGRLLFSIFRALAKYERSLELSTAERPRRLYVVVLASDTAYWWISWQGRDGKSLGELVLHSRRYYV